jgi:hypothetical protein
VIVVMFDREINNSGASVDLWGCTYKFCLNK